MWVSGCGNNNGKTLVLLACFLLLVASPLLHGVGCFAVAEATSPEEAARQRLMVGSTRALETAAPQHQHGRGDLWSYNSKSAVARRLLPAGAGHSCGSNGGQGCSP
ncbi:hypothetical protein ACQJBY_037405 [Aegilops geniculata]